MGSAEHFGRRLPPARKQPINQGFRLTQCAQMSAGNLFRV
jgi:hypothetical protein